MVLLTMILNPVMGMSNSGKNKNISTVDNNSEKDYLFEKKELSKGLLLIKIKKEDHDVVQFQQDIIKEFMKFKKMKKTQFEKYLRENNFRRRLLGLIALEVMQKQEVDKSLLFKNISDKKIQHYFEMLLADLRLAYERKQYYNFEGEIISRLLAALGDHFFEYLSTIDPASIPSEILREHIIVVVGLYADNKNTKQSEAMEFYRQFENDKSQEVHKTINYFKKEFKKSE